MPLNSDQECLHLSEHLKCCGCRLITAATLIVQTGSCGFDTLSVAVGRNRMWVMNVTRVLWIVDGCQQSLSAEVLTDPWQDSAADARSLYHISHMWMSWYYVPTHYAKLILVKHPAFIRHSQNHSYTCSPFFFRERGLKCCETKPRLKATSDLYSFARPFLSDDMSVSLHPLLVSALFSSWSDTDCFNMSLKNTVVHDILHYELLLIHYIIN